MNRTQNLPDLALIHGWGIGKAAWKPLQDHLGHHGRIHLVDLPGYGERPPSADGFESTARRLAADLPAGCLLCGWSLGALLSLQAAALFPERFRALVLFSASPSFTQSPDWSDAQPPETLAAFTAAVASDPVSALQRFNALLNQGDVQARSATRALAQALQAQPCPDRNSLIQGLAWLRDVDLRPLIASIRTPVRMFHGDRDPLMPLAAARWLQGNLPDARLDIIPGAAHAPFIHSPEGIAERIGEVCHALAHDQATCP
jgi:pimeloyl-[acyl-carrier protein] methyl ester esterase